MQQVDSMLKNFPVKFKTVIVIDQDEKKAR